MDEPIVWIIIGFLVIIISREIVCWYWKINDILEEQKQQTKILEEILYTMTKTTKKTKKKTNKAPLNRSAFFFFVPLRSFV